MIALILYSTAGCHLCEQAEQLINAMGLQDKLALTIVEIGDNEILVEQYGVQIPVLKFADNSELNWPFTSQDISHKLTLISK